MIKNIFITKNEKIYTTLYIIIYKYAKEKRKK